MHPQKVHNEERDYLYLEIGVNGRGYAMLVAARCQD